MLNGLREEKTLLVLPLQSRQMRKSASRERLIRRLLHSPSLLSLSLNVADGASKKTASCPPEAALSITTLGSSPDIASQKVPMRFRSEEEELAAAAAVWASRKSGTAPANMRSERMRSQETFLSSSIVSWITAAPPAAASFICKQRERALRPHSNQSSKCSNAKSPNSADARKFALGS